MSRQVKILSPLERERLPAEVKVCFNVERQPHKTILTESAISRSPDIEFMTPKRKKNFSRWNLRFFFKRRKFLFMGYEYGQGLKKKQQGKKRKGSCIDSDRVRPLTFHKYRPIYKLCSCRSSRLTDMFCPSATSTAKDPVALLIHTETLSTLSAHTMETFIVMRVKMSKHKNSNFWPLHFKRILDRDALFLFTTSQYWELWDLGAIGPYIDADEFYLEALYFEAGGRVTRYKTMADE